MKRVLLLANNDVGLYKFRLEVIEKMLSEGNEVFISLPNGSFVDELVKKGCTFIETEFNRHGTNPFKELALLGKYKKILSDVKPDIVLTYTIKPNIYGGIACAAKNIPYVANITGLGTAVENKGVMQLVSTTLYRHALRKAKMVFFQNSENLEFMKEKGIVKTDFDLLPGSGVNLSRYGALPYPKGETVDFLFIARVMKEKGVDQYLEAAEYIRAKYPETRFHICGACEQDYKARLDELQANETVIYHGLVKDMTEMYRIGACTVHPTYYPEGMSNVLLESSASARPVITTRRSGCREIVDEGKNGFFCEQQNSEDLIKQIERFLSLTPEEREAMGKYGREKTEREFDRSIVVGKYMEQINL